METVTVRELRNHGGEVRDRIARSESPVVARDGAEVAELVPRRRPAKTTADLIADRRTLTGMDLARLRADVDRILDASL